MQYSLNCDFSLNWHGMIIGIDASRAFVKNKTGIEEYAYQLIKHLRELLTDGRVILYLDPRVNSPENIDFELPKNWKAKFLRSPKFWTQVRLSLEMIFHPVDVLFVPAHTVPLIHPRNTIVTVHGLEYEFCPKAYSFFERLYMRWVIKNSCRWAKKIIAVSENTKRDLIKLYEIPKNKIDVVYEGYSSNNFKLNSKFQIQNNKYQILNIRYLMFIGRLEDRKNIIRMIEAFEELKRKHNISHKLILVGKFGYGEEKIRNKINSSEFRKDIVLTGYVSEKDKFYLMANADVFLFPTIYEGFGLPILEAQSVGTAVVTSNISSMPEVAGDGAVLVDPKNKEEIADAIYKLISNESHKNDIIKKGYENVKRFSWDKCAEEIVKMIKMCE